MIEISTTAADLVLCRSDMGDDGWSLHAPGSTDEDIATGEALALVTGTSRRPTDADYAAALRLAQCLQEKAAH